MALPALRLDEKASLKIFPFVERQQLVKWERLAGHLEDNFFEPDLQAIRTMMCAAAAHELWPEQAPIWIMLIGASGSGKTSQVMPLLEAFDGFYAVSHLTKATFLSGWARGEGKETGLLRKLGSSIILGVSDFTGISSMNKDNLSEVLSQMRQMYDGTVSKEFGTGHSELWKGKVTMLAGTTPEVERRFRLWSAMGDRFLLLRWRMGDPEELALAAARQEDHLAIREEMVRLAKEFVSGYLVAERPPVQKEDMVRLGLHKAAALVARLRKPLMHEGNEIVESVGGSDAEGPGRIMQTIYNLARSHAILFRREEIGDDDLAIGLRVARETVPLARWRLLELVRRVEEEGKDVSIASLTTELMNREDETQTPSGLERRLRELVVIGVLSSSEGAGQRWWRTTDWVRERIGILEEKSVDDPKGGR